MQFQKFQSKLPVALILVFAFLFACTQQVNEKDVNKTTEILNKLAEIQGIEKPNFVNATKVNLIRIEYKWNNQTLIVYTDEKNEKIRLNAWKRRKY